MPADLPLLTILTEIVRRTPVWVWGVLAALVFAGALQMRDHVLARRRVVMLPIGMSAYSLWGAIAIAGFNATTLTAWTAGLAAALAVGHQLPWASRVRHDGARNVFEVGASVWPLVLMLAVFATRYAAKVTLVFHPDWAAQAAFGGLIGTGYGALSGLLAARALAILATARATAGAQRLVPSSAAPAAI